MGSGISLLFWLAVIVVEIAAGWMVFAKAGQPGWACLIPIYNALVLLRIVGRPWWWLLLYLIPVVDVIIGIVVMLDLARVFGKRTGFGIGLILLSFIFIPILAFGDARYRGRSGMPPLAPAI